MMATTHSFKPDLVIKNLEGPPIAIVEVQTRSNLSRDVAAEIRRNMLERGLPSHLPYFMLLSQDNGYLWKEANSGTSLVQPNYEFPMRKVVERYSKHEPGQRLFEPELVYIVLDWLTNLSMQQQKVTEEPERTLAASGFNDSIKEAMVLLEEKL